MTPLLPDDFVGKCVRHFEHACEKHPKFVNILFDMQHKDAEYKLDVRRFILAASVHEYKCDTMRLAICELYEACEASLRGDKPAAIEELYDLIAVCMRTICVLEGKQELTKEVCE